MEWKTEEDIVEDQAILARFHECLAMSDRLAKQIDRLIAKIDNVLRDEARFNEESDY